MNNDWLHSFIDVAEHKSLSKAAEKRNLSQPAISKQIHNLETSLGVLLFQRSSTGVELTEAGKFFLKRITPVLSELTIIQHELQQFQDSPNIKIGALPSLASYYLPFRLKDLHLNQRPIQITIEHASANLVHSVKTGELDAALVESHYVQEPLISYKLFTESYYAIFPLTHSFHGRSSVTIADIHKEPLVIHPDQCSTRQYIAKHFQHLGYEMNIVAEVAFEQYILGSVAAGTGITILPELVAKYIGHLPLFALPITDFESTRTICLATRSAKIGHQLYEALVI